MISSLDFGLCGPRFESISKRISDHECMVLHHTEHFIIIVPSSQYCLDNVERDIKQHISIIMKHTLQPLYNLVHYNTAFDITCFKDGSQKCIDYIEK